MVALVYRLLCYVIFLATFLYAIWFVCRLSAPSTLPEGPWLKSVVIDALVLSVFAFQYSVMARQAFKRVWTKFIPKPIERSTYLLCSSLALLLIIRAWQPLPGIVWDVQPPAAKALLFALFGLRWGIVPISTFLIDHFDLFGLRQVWTYFDYQTNQPPQFQLPGFYRLVCHPIYLCFIIAFWSTPHMSSDHLFFAIMTFAYILVAI